MPCTHPRKEKKTAKISTVFCENLQVFLDRYVYCNFKNGLTGLSVADHFVAAYFASVISRPAYNTCDGLKPDHDDQDGPEVGRGGHGRVHQGIGR